DIRDIMKHPPWGSFVAPDETNYMMMHCIIVGPEDTPYEKGFFYFVVTFPSDYPMTAPKVLFMPTGAGKVRFNPNLYKCGKVCLSILGRKHAVAHCPQPSLVRFCPLTWPRPEWSPGLNLTSILVSIQSLLCEKPYHNEPGYDTERVPGDSVRYNNILRYETLR
ncbi:Ubiquitin-conjugating enzyme E2 Z, partial [Frankliniella fusca]